VGGLTLDSGAFVAIERGDGRVRAVLAEAFARDEELTVPGVVVAEVWRGGPRAAPIARALAACIVEPVGDAIARKAGEAIAMVRVASAIDAIVMASAASRADRVVTSDPKDLGRLRRVFPDVQIVAV